MIKDRGFRVFLLGLVIGIVVILLTAVLSSCARADYGDTAPVQNTTEQVEEVRPITDRWIEKVDCLEGVCVYVIRGDLLIECFIAVLNPGTRTSMTLQMECP